MAAKHTLKEDTYLTTDGSKLAGKNDKQRSLLGRKGREISMAVALKYGLAKEEKKKPADKSNKKDLENKGKK